ncbi:MAG: ribosome maturation factor RimP [Flammeovirgaceae bacterium]|nr:ribosome maturation factor RimP [Flammeovirgaceae bacterium]
MKIEKLIREIVESVLPDTSLFIVEIEISGVDKKKINVIIDGDNGVGIDKCVRVNRKLGNYLEENEVMEEAYILDVSSPGIGQPLKMLRQYKSNIGRKLEFQLKDGKVVVGKLEEVSEDQVLIEQEIAEKKKKVKLVKGVELKFENIKEAKVLVSFK